MKLVADIGGTHARFALLDAQGNPDQIRNLKTADYLDLGAAVLAYLRNVESAQTPGAHAHKPSAATALRAVISIAAPLSGDRVKMTNAAWDFSIAATQAQLQQECAPHGAPVQLHLINDFEALALAVPTLQAQELLAIGSPPGGHDQPLTKAILGPGTGLGMAGVLPTRTTLGHYSWRAIACEGGHASIAPRNARDLALLQAAGESSYQAICWEDFLSGTGLPLLHRAVCRVDGWTYQAMTAAQIGQAAQQNDPACLATLHTFCDLLGSAAGDLALMLGARGGVYIKGGVLDRVMEWSPDFLQRSAFRSSFEAKGHYRFYMQSIPTWFIETPQIALRGCASLLKENTA